jgi:hypothetical protein
MNSKEAKWEIVHPNQDMNPGLFHPRKCSIYTSHTIYSNDTFYLFALLAPHASSQRND